MTELRRRAAFDIGSAATKLMIADIAGSTVAKELFAKEIPVAFAIDWRQSSDGNLSDAIQDKGLSVLRSLISECEAHGVPATARCAIATEVFRKAGNGAAYLEKVLKELSLSVQVLSQHQEAEVGYSTAVALSDVAEVICWDSGGASFQITVKDGDGLQAYLGALGTGVVTSILVEDVQGQSLASKPTPNPVSSVEAEKLLTQLKSRLEQGPKWLQGSIVTAIGGPNSMFCIAFEALGKRHFSSTEIRAVLNRLVDQSDEQLATQAFCQGELREPPGYILPKIALLLAVMEHCEIAEVHFCSAIGSCAGLLISDDFFH